MSWGAAIACFDSAVQPRAVGRTMAVLVIRFKFLRGGFDLRDSGNYGYRRQQSKLNRVRASEDRDRAHQNCKVARIQVIAPVFLALPFSDQQRRVFIGRIYKNSIGHTAFLASNRLQQRTNCLQKLSPILWWQDDSGRGNNHAGSKCKCRARRSLRAIEKRQSIRGVGDKVRISEFSRRERGFEKCGISRLHGMPHLNAATDREI